MVAALSWSRPRRREQERDNSPRAATEQPERSGAFAGALGTAVLGLGALLAGPCSAVTGARGMYGHDLGGMGWRSTRAAKEVGHRNACPPLVADHETRSPGRVAGHPSLSVGSAMHLNAITSPRAPARQAPPEATRASSLCEPRGGGPTRARRYRDYPVFRAWRFADAAKRTRALRASPHGIQPSLPQYRRPIHRNFPIYPTAQCRAEGAARPCVRLIEAKDAWSCDQSTLSCRPSEGVVPRPSVPSSLAHRMHD